ncbi:hypothetical protein CLS_19200 [[Clostridium] cf. saccharolyticum K10]|nr:hypothetical protein CLS_19200 [[Clostridium] cf. saccharolyticum K10]
MHEKKNGTNRWECDTIEAVKKPKRAEKTIGKGEPF